jgi:hypothetical protein
LDILKNTPEEHVEYESIKESLKIMEEIAASVNESKKDFDNQNLNKELQQNFKGKYTFEINREFVKESFIKLTFLSQKIQEEPFRFLVFNDILVLYDHTKKYKRNFMFFLVLTRIKEKVNNDLVLEVVHNNTKESITLTFTIVQDLIDAVDNLNIQTEEQNLININKGKN